MKPRDLSVAHAWRGALVAATLNAIGMPGDFLLARDVPNMPWYPSVLSAIVGVGLIVLLLIRRERATVRLGSIAFLINTAVILVALWITSGYWAAAEKAWTPFQANKLGAMAAALLAPDLSVGLVAIAGFTTMPIGKYYVLDPEIRSRFPIGEPWLMLLYALFSGVLLAYRLRSMALERKTVRLQAETDAIEQLARTMLRLRDYANTPLQTIVFTAKLMRERHPELERDLGRLDRAVARLMELSRRVTRYDTAHRWIPGEESLDPAKLAEHLPKLQR